MTQARLDDGAMTSGMTVFVGSPGTHALEYWSIDRAGNEELPHHTATFTLIPAPSITSFTPTSGPVGTSVTVTGTNLTGATAVAFHGTAATTFAAASATKITATVPAGATTGKVAVTTPGGTATSTASFTVIFKPKVTLKSALRKIGAHGGYGWTYRPARRGAYRLRATIAKTMTHTAALTKWRTFKVK